MFKTLFLYYILLQCFFFKLYLNEGMEENFNSPFCSNAISKYDYGGEFLTPHFAPNFLVYTQYILQLLQKANT